MVNVVESLFGIAILAGLISGLAFIQSKSGPERAPKYRARMRRFCIIGCVALGLAIAGEVLLHMYY